MNRERGEQQWRRLRFRLGFTITLFFIVTIPLPYFIQRIELTARTPVFLGFMALFFAMLALTFGTRCPSCGKPFLKPPGLAPAPFRWPRECVNCGLPRDTNPETWFRPG
jgi:hypothetical protein